MAITIKLRYENGHFIPLSDIPGIQDGDEIEVEWTTQPSLEEIVEALNKSAGIWADVEGFEEIIEENRRLWDEEWQQRQNF